MAKVTFQGARQFERFFAKLELEMRVAVARDVMKEAAGPVVKRAKELVPQPGYPGDKPGLKALRDTIGFVVRDYPGIVVALVGPLRPAGSHGHLVEHGHRMVTRSGDQVGFVEGKPFLEAAGRQSERAIRAAMIRGLRKAFGRQVNKHFR